MKQAKIYFFIAILFIAIALVGTSCASHKSGCFATRGMSGYK